MPIRFKILKKIALFKNNAITTYLRTYFQDLFEKINTTNSELKQQVFRYLPFWVASAVCGALAYTYAVLFRYAEKTSILILEVNRLYIFILTPVCFLISWWLVRNFAPYSKGSGIPQVMASIELAKPNKDHLIRHFLSFRVIVIKILASMVKVLGGGILGREGPTIQISSSIFVEIYKFIPSWWPPISKKNILIAGAASGLAAAFNTPLGGIIFAIEELSKFHIRYYKSPLFIAVIIAGLCAQGLGGSYLYLGYPKVESSGFVAIFGVLLVSILAGYLASSMAVLILKAIRFVNSIRHLYKQIALVLFCSLLVSTGIYCFGIDAMGSGKELMERVLFTSDKSVPWYIPIVRIGGLISTFSFGGAGGIFAPSLSSGASIGAVVAGWLSISEYNSNMLILVGMTAFLTGVTRSPFTSAIIVFEMTDRHSLIFFLMIAAVIANAVGSFVDKKSFYDHLKDSYLAAVEQEPVQS